MKISQIYIQNVQTVGNTPLILSLSNGITRIDGPNASGKSLIVKAINVFSGIYTKEDFRSLLPKSATPATISKIGILLEDDKSVWCTITELAKRVYYTVLDENGIPIEKYVDYDDKISNYTKWKVVQNETLNLNIKTNKTNLFIDTIPTTNAEIIEYICRDTELERKIEDLTNNISEIEKASSEASVWAVKQANLVYTSVGLPPADLEYFLDIEEKLYNKYRHLMVLYNLCNGLHLLHLYTYTNNLVRRYKYLLHLYNLTIQSENTLQIAKSRQTLEKWELCMALSNIIDADTRKYRSVLTKMSLMQDLHQITTSQVYDLRQILQKYSIVKSLHAICALKELRNTKYESIKGNVCPMCKNVLK